MSKPSRRPNREEIKAQNKQYKKAQRQLLQDEKAKGLQKSSRVTISNCKCRFESIEQEGRIRNETVAEHLSIFRSKLPVLLKRLAKIHDPRNPKKIKHKVSTLSNSKFSGTLKKMETIDSISDNPMMDEKIYL